MSLGRIPDYRVETQGTLGSLECIITDRMEDGWLPTGGPFQLPSGSWGQAIYLPKHETSEGSNTDG